MSSPSAAVDHHLVVKGDTAWSIALANDITLEDLKAANHHLVTPANPHLNHIEPGWVLHVPSVSAFPPDEPAEPPIDEPAEAPDPADPVLDEPVMMTPESVGARLGGGTTVTAFEPDGQTVDFDAGVLSLFDGDHMRVNATRASVHWKERAGGGIGDTLANIRGTWFKAGPKWAAFNTKTVAFHNIGRTPRFSQMFPITWGYANRARENMQRVIDNDRFLRRAGTNGSPDQMVRAHDFFADIRTELVRAHESHADGLFNLCDATFVVWEACMGWTPWSVWQAAANFAEVPNSEHEQILPEHVDAAVALFVECFETVAEIMNFGDGEGQLPIKWGLGLGRPGMLNVEGSHISRNWPAVGEKLVDGWAASSIINGKMLENDKYRRNSHVIDTDGVRARVSPPELLELAYGPELDLWLKLAKRHNLLTSLGEWNVEVDDPNFIVFLARKLTEHGYLDDGVTPRFHMSQMFFKPRNSDSSYNLVDDRPDLGWTEFHPRAHAAYKALFCDLEDPFAYPWADPEPMDPNAPWTYDEGEGGDSGNNVDPTAPA